VDGIEAYGSPEEVAVLVLPPGATLDRQPTTATLVPPARSDETPLPRQYYRYEFTRGPLRGTLLAAAHRGKAYVLLATRPLQAEAMSGDMTAMLDSFRVLT
jgi:hypothetical protein